MENVAKTAVYIPNTDNAKLSVKCFQLAVDRSWSAWPQQQRVLQISLHKNTRCYGTLY